MRDAPTIQNDVHNSSCNLRFDPFPATTASPDVTFQYDWLSRLTNMVDASGTNKYTYTAGSQILTEDGPFARSLAFIVYWPSTLNLRLSTFDEPFALRDLRYLLLKDLEASTIILPVRVQRLGSRVQYRKASRRDRSRRRPRSLLRPPLSWVAGSQIKKCFIDFQRLITFRQSIFALISTRSRVSVTLTIFATHCPCIS